MNNIETKIEQIEAPLKQDLNPRESVARSLLKSISWRIVATTTIILIVYIKTGDIAGAIAIGSIEFFIKFALYYLHERAWNLVPSGSVRSWFGPKKS